MQLKIDDLNNGNIYLEKTELAKRIDFAWSVYVNKENTENNRKKALHFLIYAFDINDPNDINKQLIELMEKRDLYKNQNPEYIPGKTPKNIPFEIQINPINKPKSNTEQPKEIKNLINKKEILAVNKSDEEYDKYKTIYLDSQKRAKHRVIIQGGVFQKNGKPFDTSNMSSHGKKGFAAFTLNANGELSIFNHYKMQDKIGHSSMNAGSPVISAGELKIENGILKGITTYSGHYNPSLFNVYRLLEHFSENKVDISETDVLTFINPSSYMPAISSKRFNDESLNYSTPANQIYDSMNLLIQNSIDSIQEDIGLYQSGGLKQSLLKLKDKIIGSELTKKRSSLSNEFKDEIESFKKEIEKIQPEEIKNKIEDLNKIIKKYEEKNEKLSKEHNKNKGSGRLAEKISEFKIQMKHLQELKKMEESKENDISNSVITKLMKKLY